MGVGAVKLEMYYSFNIACFHLLCLWIYSVYALKKIKDVRDHGLEGLNESAFCVLWLGTELFLYTFVLLQHLQD